MSLLRKFPKFDTKTEYSVHGWIREAETQLQMVHTPIMIMSICTLFYDENDKFGSIGKNVKVSNNKKTIEKISNDGWDINQKLQTFCCNDGLWNHMRDY